MRSNFPTVILLLLPTVIIASGVLHQIFTTSTTVKFQFQIAHHKSYENKHAKPFMYYLTPDQRKVAEIPMPEYGEDYDYKVSIFNKTTEEQIGSTIHRRMILKKSDQYLEDVYFINQIRFTIKTKFQCAENFYGPRCEDFCQDQGAKSGRQRCDKETGQLRCDIGWMGPKCAQAIDPRQCNCQNSGTCVSTATNDSVLECECHKGFTGPKCENGAIESIDNSHICSAEHVCLNGGKCHPNGMNRYCECQTGFIGEFCQAFVDAPTQMEEESVVFKWEVMATLAILIVFIFFVVRHIRHRRSMEVKFILGDMARQLAKPKETCEELCIINPYSDFSGKCQEEEHAYATIEDVV